MIYNHTYSNIHANTKSSGERRILRLPPLNISLLAQIMSNRLSPQTGRARSPSAPQAIYNAANSQILPWPILLATSAPSGDSRRRLASCTCRPRRISTTASLYRLGLSLSAIFKLIGTLICKIRHINKEIYGSDNELLAISFATF